jgi:hypothetical protein
VCNVTESHPLTLLQHVKKNAQAFVCDDHVTSLSSRQHASRLDHSAQLSFVPEHIRLLERVSFEHE